MSIKQQSKIKELQEEIKRLRKLGRITRTPKMGTIGGTVHRIRELRELTLSDLAVKAGIAKGQVHRLECHPNQNPTFNTLSYVADALGLTLSQLISEYEKDKAEA